MTDAVPATGASVAGRYAIEREIGRGGFATVYLARDLRHNRHVALKVLDRDIAVEAGGKRFPEEIRVTARLQHPNILPLFDSGVADGALFYVMPFVAGESLRAKLDREGRLDVGEALRITGAIASGLDYAHRHGIVHRDVKPENVLLSDGAPIVADFGIAKALASDRGEGPTGDRSLTRAGMALGTVRYMSPEQAMGEPVDGRSDVYALGCLLYEMLAGDVPFTGPAQSVVVQHLTAPAPSVRERRDSVPVNVDAAIERALAKDPGQRFRTPAELAAALYAPPPVEPMPDYSRVTEPFARSAAPFAGRRRELAAVTAKLDALAQGTGSFVLLGGEPGVGKTKLAEAVMLEARRRGYFCAVGHCYEMEGGPPYLPFLEQLEYTSRVVPPGRFRALLGSAAGEIARIMPGIRQLYTDVPAPLELPPEQQRHYLQSCMREYFERGSRNLPVVLLFDDLHWADESTLALLEHLAPHLPQLRLLVLGTYRDVELDVSRPFASTLERLTRQRLADRTTLRRMPESDVAEMLALLGAPDPPAPLVATIFRETDGNPFFVAEVFQHLREEGRLLDANGAWRADLHIDEVDVPEGVRLVIGRRLERVGASCRGVLTAAAVVGPQFTLALLEALGEHDSDTLLDALEKAEAAGLVLSRSVGRGTRYTFAHELIRHTLLSSLSMPRRQRRHQKTADPVEKAYGGKVGEHASELAYHLFQAGAAVDSERTIRALLLAGRQALVAGAFDEALTHGDRALSILETEGGRDQADILRLRGEALRGLGRWSTAAEVLDQARGLYEALGDRDEVVATVLALSDVLLIDASASVRLNHLLANTLALLSEAPSASRVALLVRAGYPMAMTGGHDAGLVPLNEASRLATALGDERLIAESLCARGVHYYTFGRTDEAIADLTAAYRVLTDAGERWEGLRAGAYLANALAIGGRVGEALGILPSILHASLELGHLAAWYVADISSGIANWCSTASAADLKAFGEHAIESWGEVGSRSDGGSLFLALADFELEASDDPASTILEHGMRHGNPAWDDWAWGEYFFLSAQTHPARALGILEQHVHRLPRTGEYPGAGAFVALDFVIRGLAILGRSERAAAYYPQAVAYLHRGNRMNLESVFECACGIAAAGGKQWELAERHFANAIQTALTAPHLPAQGDVRRWRAWMLAARGAPGDLGRARSMLSDSIAHFERVKLPRRARICAEILAGLG